MWFDRPSLGLDEDEHQGSVDAMARQLGHLIDAEVRAGVPLHRIVLGMYIFLGRVVHTFSQYRMSSSDLNAVPVGLAESDCFVWLGMSLAVQWCCIQRV